MPPVIPWMRAELEEPSAKGRVANGSSRMRIAGLHALFAIGHSPLPYFAGGLCLTKAVTMSFCADSTALFAVARWAPASMFGYCVVR